MTKLQNMQRKYGNAVRALIGNLNTAPCRDDATHDRVKLWEERLAESGREQPKVSLYALMP